MNRPQVRPVVLWPGPTTKSPVRSPFEATYSATLELLDRELRQLAARRPVVELFVHEYQIKVDGELKATATPYQPGVVLLFDSRHGALRYSCDRFTHWHHNLRAIALGLEALRKIDRYGIGTGSEQYTGYRALPPGGIALGAGMSVDEAAEFLAAQSGMPLMDAGDLLDAPGVPHADGVKHAYRLASKRLHPDTGGDAALFARLTEAYEVLTKGAQ